MLVWQGSLRSLNPKSWFCSNFWNITYCSSFHWFSLSSVSAKIPSMVVISLQFLEYFLLINIPLVLHWQDSLLRFNSRSWLCFSFWNISYCSSFHWCYFVKGLCKDSFPGRDYTSASGIFHTAHHSIGACLWRTAAEIQSKVMIFLQFLEYLILLIIPLVLDC